MNTTKKILSVIMLALALSASIPLQSCDRYTHKAKDSAADPANPGATETQAPGVNQMADTTSTNE